MTSTTLSPFISVRQQKINDHLIELVVLKKPLQALVLGGASGIIWLDFLEEVVSWFHREPQVVT